jgi:sugar O-acyltransferase (sialic acid O-acetyltransferase NeuD family)
MPNEKQPVFVFGASGHAKVVIDILEKSNVFSIQFLVDDAPLLKGSDFFGYPVIGGKNELLAQKVGTSCAIVAIGKNETRFAISLWLKQNGFQIISAIHPSAQIGREVEIGAGTVVMAHAVINSASRIGENVIVNTGAKIDHDCIIGDGVHIAPGTTLCGTVQVGEKSFIGAGSTVINNITIGKCVFVGAGTVVYSDIPDGMKIVGPRNTVA